MGVEGVLVTIRQGEHLCMKMRGVRNSSLIITVTHRGVMEQKEFREHVLPLIYSSKQEMHSIR